MAIQNDGGGSYSGTAKKSGTKYPNSIFYKPTNTAPSQGYAAPAASQPPAPVPAPAPAPSYSGGGGGGGAAPAAAPAAPPAPAPMKDIDWFNQDSVYRAESGRALSDLTQQLAQILADRDAGYRQLDNSRGDLGRAREFDLTSLGNDFAARGLNASGLYAQSDDELQADYTRQGTALDETANRLAQMYGQQGNTVNLGGIKNGASQASLASIWGLLGSMGIGAGNNYNNALGQARAESAARATGPLIQTTTW